MMKAYHSMDMIRLPEPIKELGLKAGTPGAIDTVSRKSDEKILLLVDVSGPKLPASAIVEIEVAKDGAERVVSYTKL